MVTVVEEVALVPATTQSEDDKVSNKTELYRPEEHNVSIRLFTSKKHLRASVVWLVSFICLLIVAGPLSAQISFAIPAVKTRSVADDIFSEERARDCLNNLTRYGPRVIHTRGNDDARDFLIVQIKRIFSMNKRHLRFELDLQNLTEYGHHQLQNILVRVSNPTNDVTKVPSLMLSAHYDTVEYSPGGCDDGSGVVILVELLSNLINDVRMTFSDVHLIVLLTNAEEMGLLGAQAFMTNHTWRSNIHRFINVDSTSCKEMANLTQLEPSELIRDYSRVPRPRATVILSSLLHWLGIATEYITYRSNGSRSGYDIGFFIDSYTYHTTLDHPSRVNQGIIQGLGDNLGVLIRNILLEGVQKTESLPDNDPMIYFDIYGRYLIFYRMSTSIIIQVILITTMIVIGVILIVFDEIFHRKRSLSCIDSRCIYFHFERSFSLRLILIILNLISNLCSIFFGFLFSTIIALILSFTRPLSWFGSSKLAICLFSLPCLIGLITATHLWDVFHRYILRRYLKNSFRCNGTVDNNYLNDIKFDFEQNISVVFVYGLLMIISIYFQNQLFYIILVWSIFLCPVYLLMMVIEFVIHWKEIHWNFFEGRDYWLYLPMIISLFPLTHTIEIMNRLIRVLSTFLSQRFSYPSWSFRGNLCICTVVVVPTTLFALIFLPILRRTKYFGRTLLILFSITFLIACIRQPFSNIHPNTFYAKHTSKSIFQVDSLSIAPLIVSLQSQSFSTAVMTHNGFSVSTLLDHFSAKSGHIFQYRLCFTPTDCRFDDTFNRTIAVQNIQIESIENLTNYTIIVRHVSSYNILISSFASITYNVRNELIVPRTETIIDVTSDSTQFSFMININIKRCDLNDSPFLVLFTRLMSDIVLVGEGQCQAIEDETILIVNRKEIV